MTPLPAAALDTRAVPFARGLAAHGDRIALITRDGEMSYRDLAAQVEEAGRRLGDQRRLVLLAGANRTESVIGYLAALAVGSPVLVVPGNDQAKLRAMVAAYDPDVVIGEIDGAWRMDERRDGSAHVLHPDLAMLLSTSGSTGSPKLVRLTHDNLQANAESIAEYLGIRADDRAATTLPMHYCYGLSVINSHLLRGAALILTDMSVADACFWDLFRDGRGSTFAGVPYTFDVLDRIGFDRMRLPDLRYVTQAGGRMDPDRVERYAELGRHAGWDLFVMYGQTEATARMAYLPPDLATAHPDAIGVPVPGGSFRLEPLPDHADPDVGELVYTGPNVMLGYAESPADLRLGRTVTELFTGDIARRGDGLYRIVGRRSRFLKLFGLRIDLQGMETALERHGVTACCFGDDAELVVAVVGAGDPARIQRLAADAANLPVRAVRVCFLAELPRLASGKTDYRSVERQVLAGGVPAGSVTAAPTADVAAGDLRALYAELLDCDYADVTEDSTFVNLGGDSLSYVEMSIRLEQVLGTLPPNWHTTPLGDLRKTAPPVKRRRTLETSVALRAVSILLIVGTHIQLFNLSGGAHLLLGVAGFNFARFQLTGAERGERTANLRRSIGRVVIASATWITLVFLFADQYSLANIFLVNSVVGTDESRNTWHFWFLEDLVYFLLALMAILSLRPVDRWERRLPFALPMALMAVGLIARYQFIPGIHLPKATAVFWLFALGWAAAKATNRWQRLLVTAAALATIPGFFHDPSREALIMVGFTALIWVGSVPSARLVSAVAGALASSSLYIYLTHWQIYPHLYGHSTVLAMLACLVLGIAYATLMNRATAQLSKLRRRVRLRIPVGQRLDSKTEGVLN